VIRSGCEVADPGDVKNDNARMSRRTRYPLIGLALAAVAVPAAGVAGATPAKTVTLKDIAFSPSRLAVAKGTTVRFSWRDDGTLHNVTSVGRTRFKTLGDRSSGTRSVRFAKAGTYRYECTLHPGMTGRITVR
jgi:plastocyanin